MNSSLSSFRKRLLTSFQIILLVCFSSVVIAQNASINGKITSSDGQPAEFVNVGLIGTNKTSTSNAQGQYKIENIPNGEYTLQVSRINCTEIRKKLIINNNDKIIFDFTLTETEKQLQEIIVTESRTANQKPVSIGKTAIAPIDLPQSISVIDKDILTQQQTLRLGDALKNVNGVYIMGTSGGVQEEIAGRGFSFSSNNTFKNGVRFNNSCMPEMTGVERMEIMKGSTAILFGNVAAGGIINLVTKKPLFEQGGEITMRIGSYDFYKPAIDIYGGITKNIAYRVNTAYEKSHSFRDEVRANRFYINPSFLVKLGEKSDLLFESDYMKDNRTSDFGVGAINYELIDVPRNRFLGTKWSYCNTEQQGVTTTFTHHITNNWDVRAVTSYQNYANDLFSTTRPNSSSQFIQTDGTWVRGIQRTEIKQDYYIVQLDLIGKFSTGFLTHNLLFGADIDKYLNNTTAYNGISKYDTINVFDLYKHKQRNDVPDLSKRTLTKAPTERVGVYVQDLISITQKLKILAGVRLSYLETISNVYTYATNNAEQATQYDHAITPRFGLVFQPINTIALFASYSNSFTPNAGIDVNGKALPPSYINQYEAGFKSDLFKDLFSANITIYQIVNSNLAQTSLANGNTSSNVKELAGEVTSKGLEIDLISKSLNGYSLIAGYSFNETKYTKSNTYIIGSKLRYNPSNTANASLYYTFNNSSALSGFNAGVSVLYFGKRFAGRSTRLNVVNDNFKLIPLPAFNQIDATIGYTKNKLSIRLKLANVTNELSYFVHDDNSVNPIAPREISATVSLKL